MCVQKYGHIDAENQIINSLFQALLCNGQHTGMKNNSTNALSPSKIQLKIMGLCSNLRNPTDGTFVESPIKLKLPMISKNTIEVVIASSLE